MNMFIKETICPLIGAGIFLVVFRIAVAHAKDDSFFPTSPPHATTSVGDERIPRKSERAFEDTHSQSIRLKPLITISPFSRTN
jgi:hypothetical protein